MPGIHGSRLGEVVLHHGRELGRCRGPSAPWVVRDRTTGWRMLCFSAALGFGSYTTVSDDVMAMGREALAEARKAVELDGDNPDVLLAAGAAHYFLACSKNHMVCLTRAVELNPNNGMACGMFGNANAILGRPDDGIELIERAMRLSPRRREFIGRVGAAAVMRPLDARGGAGAQNPAYLILQKRAREDHPLSIG